MNNKLILIGLILVLTGSWGCRKDELTTPVAVNMRISLKANEQSYLKIDNGEVIFDQIIFEGRREEGADVFFNTYPYDNIGPVKFDKSPDGVFVKHFDIPQGVYKYMNWQFELAVLHGGAFVRDDDETSSDDDDDLMGMILTGSYENLSGSIIPVVISIDEDEKFRVNVGDDTGYDINSFTSGNVYSANLLVDAGYAVSVISRQSLEEAEINDDSDKPFMLISSDENEDLYEIILYRLQSSIRVTIN